MPCDLIPEGLQSGRITLDIGLGVSLPCREAARGPARIQPNGVDRQLALGNSIGELDDTCRGCVVEAYHAMDAGRDRHQCLRIMIGRRQVFQHQLSKLILAIDPISAIAHYDNGW